MGIFKIKDVEKLMTAYIYEVEANTAEEALEKYINELAGSLTHIDKYWVDEKNESITVL